MTAPASDVLHQVRPIAANHLWYLLCLRASRAFHRALDDVASTQQAILLRLVQRNAATVWGQRYGFQHIRSVADYQARVPLTTYADYHEAIEHISQGQKDVLTTDPVVLLEPTSGSTAATKHIPYTAALKAEFQRAIAPWVVDLFRHYPTLRTGPAYWSVTPVTRRNATTPGGIPIGFETDSSYFGQVQRHLIAALMAVPPLVRLIDDMATFRYVTLLFLLRCRSLAFISVWNPTFLTLLVEPLGDWCSQLVADIACGSLSPPQPLPAALHRQLAAYNRPNPRRADEIRAAWAAGNDPGTLHARLWPNLQLISCWADAWAARALPELTRRFPQARIQGKGLLATEGCVSIPLVGHSGAALAVRSHFFEFLPAPPGPARPAQHPPPLLAHQLEPGNDYSVILTTGGGLYRYQLHDLVQVVGWLKTCPLLRFVGKAAHISDRCGEKIHEVHVRQALDSLLQRYALDAAFAMVACEQYDRHYAYTLFIEAPASPNAVLQALGHDLEILLQANYHYRYCRDLGQLQALRVFRITQDGQADYLAQCQRHGQRAGDIKPVALHQHPGWVQAFRGSLLPEEMG